MKGVLNGANVYGELAWSVAGEKGYCVLVLMNVVWGEAGIRRTVCSRSARHDGERKEKGAQIQDEAYAKHSEQAQGGTA